LSRTIIWGRTNWEVFWDWLNCKAEELTVFTVDGLEHPLKSFDVQVWLCEMWEEFHSSEENVNETKKRT